jgi:hypothetical protein
MEALKEVAARTGPRWALEQGYAGHLEAITALQSIISQDALHKMAEDAVTIGLSYNDWPKIGCVNHDCDKCKAAQPSCPECVFGMCHCGVAGGQNQPAPVQEPFAWCVDSENSADWAIAKTKEGVEVNAKLMDAECIKTVPFPLYTTPPAPQPVPVKTYHDFEPLPVAPVPDGPYSAPIKELWPVAPKPWVGLSEEEVYEAAHYCVKSGQSVNETIRAIEAKLKSKNEY